MPLIGRLRKFRRKFLQSQKSYDLVRMPLDGIIINHFSVNIAVLVRIALDGIITNYFFDNIAVLVRMALDGIIKNHF
jgi:hypothetical protein